MSGIHLIAPNRLKTYLELMQTTIKVCIFMLILQVKPGELC